MYQLYIRGENYRDVVLCEDYDEIQDTLLVNFYDAYDLPIPADDGLMIADLLSRGYSISIEVLS